MPSFWISGMYGKIYHNIMFQELPKMDINGLSGSGKQLNPIDSNLWQIRNDVDTSGYPSSGLQSHGPFPIDVGHVHPGTTGRTTLERKGRCRNPPVPSFGSSNAWSHNFVPQTDHFSKPSQRQTSKMSAIFMIQGTYCLGHPTILEGRLLMGPGAGSGTGAGRGWVDPGHHWQVLSGTHRPGGNRDTFLSKKIWGIWVFGILEEPWKTYWWDSFGLQLCIQEEEKVRHFIASFCLNPPNQNL